MNTKDFSEDAEPGWYFVRFRHGEDPSNPDDWSPWGCVEVFGGYEHNGYEDGFVDENGQTVLFSDLSDADRYEWGGPVPMPDEEAHHG